MNGIRISHGAQVVLARLEAGGFEGYLVGGCVRDALMGRMAADADIATNALPQQVMELFTDIPVIPTGIKHGTVTVMAGEPIEVTTYRCDGEYTDARHPESVTFTTSIAQDLARRDFTVNAIAYSEKRGLVDPFGGVQDIKNGVLRTVNDPQERFSEDALRILRGMRFYSVLGFAPHKDTANAMRTLAPLLDKISAERIFSELQKLLMGKNVLNALLDFSDIICRILPEMQPCIAFDQRSRHHDYDVYTHIARAVAFSDANVILRLAALLHDIKKPACFTIDQRGGHFYGHAKASAQAADAILHRLKCDNHTHLAVCRLVRHHDDDLPASRIATRQWIRRFGADCGPLLRLKYADHMAKKQPEPNEKLAQVQRVYEDILAKGECCSLAELSVTGRDLVALGYCGPAVGAQLERILDMVITEKLPNQKDKILCFIEQQQKGKT